MKLLWSVQKSTERFLIGILLFVIILSYPFGVRAYTNELNRVALAIADKIGHSGIRTVAVSDFTDLQGEVTELGRFLAEHLSVALTGSGNNLAVIDRMHIKTLLKEHKLSTTGLIEPSTAKQLGRIAGVQALVTGTLTPFGDTVEMTIKILDTETARIVNAQKVSLAKTQTIRELLGKGITTSNSLTSSGVRQTKEVNGFIFELQWCKRQGQNIDCHLLVTNKNEELVLGFPPKKSSIIDDSGNAYNTRWVMLGSNKQGSITARMRMFTDIPQKAILHFEGVSSQAKTVTLFVIDASIMHGGGSGDRFAVKFSNIPISKLEH